MSITLIELLLFAVIVQLYFILYNQFKIIDLLRNISYGERYISDGCGSGRQAEIDEENRLRVVIEADS